MTDSFGAPGGIAAFNRRVLRGLDNHPAINAVTVLSYRYEDGDEDASSGFAKTEWRSVPRRDKVSFVQSAARAVATSGFDALICGHINFSVLSASLSTLSKARLWTITHGIEAWSKPSMWTAVAFDRSRIVTSVSRYTQRRIQSWSSLRNDAFVLLPNTVDTERFTPGAPDSNTRDRLGIAATSNVLLTVGRLNSSERYKGHDLVLRALPFVLDANPDTVYLVVGQGDDQMRLRALAARLGVTENTRFVDDITALELPSVYRAADLFVMPSKGEGFGIVYLEAAASGLPFVASEWDAGAEVAHALDQLTIGVNEPSVAAAKILEAQARSTNRQRLAESVDRCFGRVAFEAQLELVLTRLISQPSELS
ncbi:MAG: glycosyltransferase family 4 protein [Myxococcota bacterium]